MARETTLTYSGPQQMIVELQREVGLVDDPADAGKGEDIKVPADQAKRLLDVHGFAEKGKPPAPMGLAAGQQDLATKSDLEDRARAMGLEVFAADDRASLGARIREHGGDASKSAEARPEEDPEAPGGDA